MEDSYLVDMPQPPEVRKANFAAWCRRVLDQAKVQRGLSVPQIAELAGIGNQTISRWRNGTLKELPNPEQVVAFCDALDIDPAIPFGILWPGKSEAAPRPEPIVFDADYQALQRKLNDPHVSEFEKAFIRESLRQLVDRPGRPAEQQTPQRSRRRGAKN